MINNRPSFLEENIRFYKEFPTEYNLGVDYSKLPELLNLDLNFLNGILPLTKSRFEYIEKNGDVNRNTETVFLANPFPEEYEYYESIGATEFQAILIVINFHTFKEDAKNSLIGFPYSISLVPMERDKKIDTWNIDLLKKMNLDQICQDNRYVYSDFNPFRGWYDGFVSEYNIFSKVKHLDYSDCIGFVHGMYFLSPIYDRREVLMMENNSFSKQLNANFKKYKTDLYFKQFKNTQPRRIWGCDSPIELFVLQGLCLRGLYPEIQMGFYKNGKTFPNYYKMQESELWIGQEQLITSADFFFPSKKLAVFCDGKNFHDEKKDKIINKKLNDMGISTLRYSGKQINENLTAVLDDIGKKLE